MHLLYLSCSLYYKCYLDEPQLENHLLSSQMQNQIRILTTHNLENRN